MIVRFRVSPLNNAVDSSDIPQACSAVNDCCPLLLNYSEANSYYWYGFLSPVIKNKFNIKIRLIFDEVIMLILVFLYVIIHYVI